MEATAKPTRGDQTRQALLDAGTEIFGRDGFHAASSRSLAGAAQVNQALIGYHFGGKEGLYLAVFEFIADQVSASMQPVAAVARQSLEAARASGDELHATALGALEKILFGFAAMLGQEKTTAWARLILREQQDPGPAFDILYGSFMSRLLDLISELVACLTGDDPDDDAPRLCALTLMGQVLVFRAARAATLRHMNWSSIGEKEIGEIQQQLRLNLAARFPAPAPGAPRKESQP
ncbi:MAG: CerR family C-terminal domain-containing protein [Pseudomonadota bacterium]